MNAERGNNCLPTFRFVMSLYLLLCLSKITENPINRHSHQLHTPVYNNTIYKN